MSTSRFLEVDDLTPAEFAAVLDTAERWKAARPSGSRSSWPARES